MISTNKHFSSTIKGILALLEHLSNKEKFKGFILKYYKNVKEVEINKSYIWFVACIFEELCSDITGLNPFFDGLKDVELEEGGVHPIHFSLYCTNTIKGKYIYYIYKFISENLFQVQSLDETFDKLTNFLNENQVFIEFYSNLPISISKLNLYSMIEGLIRPHLNPYFICKDFSFYQSRYFKDFLLEF